MLQVRCSGAKCQYCDNYTSSWYAWVSDEFAASIVHTCTMLDCGRDFVIKYTIEIKDVETFAIKEKSKKKRNKESK